MKFLFVIMYVEHSRNIMTYDLVVGFKLFY